MGLRGPRPTDPAALAARGSYRKHPERAPSNAGPRRLVTRQRHKAKAEANILALAARLLSEAKKLLALTLSPKELQEMQDRLASEETVFGAYVERGELGALVLLVETPENKGLSEGEVVATILPRGARSNAEAFPLLDVEHRET